MGGAEEAPSAASEGAPDAAAEDAPDAAAEDAADAAAPGVQDRVGTAVLQSDDAEPGAPAQDTHPLHDQPSASVSTAVMEYVQAAGQASEPGAPASAAEGPGTQAGTPARVPEPQQGAGQPGLSAAQVLESMSSIARRLEGWPAQLWGAAVCSPAAGAAPAAPARCEQQQHTSCEAPQPAAAGAGSDLPSGAFLTPQLVVEACQRAGACCAGGSRWQCRRTDSLAVVASTQHQTRPLTPIQCMPSEWCGATCLLSRRPLAHDGMCAGSAGCSAHRAQRVELLLHDRCAPSAG